MPGIVTILHPTVFSENSRYAFQTACALARDNRATLLVPRHTSKGVILVHCLEGRVAFTALGKTQTLAAGTLLHLSAGEPHVLKGIEDASLLLTILVPRV